MLNAVDIAVIALVAAGALVGLRRGLSGELAGMVALVISVLAGVASCRPFGAFIEAHTRLSGRSAFALAFTASICLCLLLMLVLRLLTRNIVAVTVSSKPLDRILGAVAGALKAAVAALVVIVAANLWPHPYINRTFGRESVVGSVVSRMMPRAREAIEDTLDGDDFDDAVRRIGKQVGPGKD